MSDILCVTNRRLCRENFLTRIEKIAACRPAGIILREKDLSPTAYVRLAGEVLAICRQYGVRCILHSFADAALEVGAGEIHLPLPALRQIGKEDVVRFTRLGASCHSVEDALEAQQLGCTYITAGHIFETDCKQGPFFSAGSMRRCFSSGIRHRGDRPPKYWTGPRRRRSGRLSDAQFNGK